VLRTDLSRVRVAAKTNSRSALRAGEPRDFRFPSRRLARHGGSPECFRFGCGHGSAFPVTHRRRRHRIMTSSRDVVAQWRHRRRLHRIMTSHNGAFASFVSLHPDISAHTKVARRRNADISLQSYFLAPKLIAILGRIAYKAEMWPIPPRLVVCISVCVGHDYEPCKNG